MTVPVQTIINSYTSAGTSTFIYSFQALSSSHIVVTVNGITKTLGTDYAVTGVGVQSGGTITGLATVAGDAVVIKRVVPLERLTDYQNNGDLLAKTLNPDFDSIWQALQQLQQYGSKSALRVQDGETLTALAAAATRAGKMPVFNASTGDVELSTFTFTQVASAVAAAYAAGSTADAVTFLQSGTGAVARTVQDKARESVSVSDFTGANDSAKVQAAVDHCLANNCDLLVDRAYTITTSVKINRLVDTTTNDFRITGTSSNAGFYTTSAVTVFDSTLAYGAANAWGAFAPVSENIVFENIQFETSVSTTASYALSGKFLRVKFLNCRFQQMKCANASTAYLQTWYFLDCTIRYCAGTTFLTGLGSFDVSFLHNIIENNYRLFYSAPSAPGGNSGFRLIDNVIEGTNIVSGVGTLGMTGVANCVIAHNHIEQNINADFNFSVGTSAPSFNLLIEGNYIVCDTGKVAFYHWTNTNVTSIGNTLISTGGTAGQMHNQVDRITNFVSINDTILYSGTLSDATIYSIVNGVYRAGAAATAWTDSANHITKSTAGNFGVGKAAGAAVRLGVLGVDQTASNYAAVLYDSGGNTIVSFRNDRVVSIPALANYANDAAAATGGIPIGGLYRIANAVQVRLV